MVINLWFNKAMQEWRWTLTETKMLEQHSGNRKELREAMNDVASTVEYILEEKCEE